MQRHRILGWLTALFADTGHGARQAGVAQVDRALLDGASVPEAAFQDQQRVLEFSSFETTEFRFE